MNHEMSLTEDSFNRIKSGKKIIEVRLFDEKRQAIKLGDFITFYKLPERFDKIVVQVKGLSRFNSFRELFLAFDKSKFGHAEEVKLDNQIQSMREVYSEENEKKFGVIGIHIQLIN